MPGTRPKYTCQKCRNKIPVDDLEVVFVEERKAFFLSLDELARHLWAADHTLRRMERLVEVLEAERAKVVSESDKLYQFCINGALDVRCFWNETTPWRRGLPSSPTRYPAPRPTAMSCACR